MAEMWAFYLPTNHPTGMSGVEGGVSSNTEIDPKLNALLTHQGTDDVSDKNQYRKFFIEQVGVGTFENVSLELANVEYTGQISFAITGHPNGQAFGEYTGSAPSPASLPDGWDDNSNFTGNSATPITGLANSTQGDVMEVWMRQYIASSTADDELATFVMRVRATKTD